MIIIGIPIKNPIIFETIWATQLWWEAAALFVFLFWVKFPWLQNTLKCFVAEMSFLKVCSNRAVNVYIYTYIWVYISLYIYIYYILMICICIYSQSSLFEAFQDVAFENIFSSSMHCIGSFASHFPRYAPWYQGIDINSPWFVFEKSVKRGEKDTKFLSQMYAFWKSGDNCISWLLRLLVYYSRNLKGQIRHLRICH